MSSKKLTKFNKDTFFYSLYESIESHNNSCVNGLYNERSMESNLQWITSIIDYLLFNNFIDLSAYNTYQNSLKRQITKKGTIYEQNTIPD